MLQVQQIDPESRATVRRFVDLPFHVYGDDPRWVPPLLRDAAVVFDRRRHPFYEHSDAAFFLVQRDGRDVGRIAGIEHKPYNQWHGLRQASFSLFECRDQDEDAAATLFERLSDWAGARGLDQVVGPKGFSVFDGYGLLVDGFERRQLMTMTGYNPAWYGRLLQRIGFEKEVDFVSYELTRETFVMPETVHRAARSAARRLQIVRYPSRSALIRAARDIGRTYNRAFVGNWEFYPLSDREIDFAVEQMRPVADHRVMTFIAVDGEVVGFVLGFADVSAALQRMRGRLTPWGVLDLLDTRRRTTRVALNGAGILPEYQGRGGNALLYLQIERAVREASYFTAELPQVAETARRMRRDLERLGATSIKTHRVYCRVL